MPKQQKKRLLCGSEGCQTRASYMFLGIHVRPMYCGRHRLEGARLVYGSFCEVAECHTSASFGNDGRRLRCGAHRLLDDVLIGARTCVHPECRVQPTFGEEGKKDALWCAAHKPDDAVDVHNRTCQHPGCRVHPSFGEPGTKTALWCASHKPGGAVDVLNPKCRHPDCRVQPNFGEPGTKTALWCASHKPAGAVDVTHSKCEHPQCQTRPSYGIGGVGAVARWCVTHAPAGSEDVTSKRCATDGCDVVVYATHERCANCDPEKRRRARVRETRAANFLRDEGLHWTSWNRQLGERECGVYRPDFVYDLPTHVVLVEVDEDQHRTYSPVCERKREVDIYGSYGGTPVVFLRWNPDDFLLRGDPCPRDEAYRHAALARVLRAHLATPPTEALTLVRMFYDGDSEITARWIDPMDPAFREHPLLPAPTAEPREPRSVRRTQ